MQAKGLPVCNLTVGDFDPKQLPDSDGAARRARARRSSPDRRITRPPRASCRCARPSCGSTSGISGSSYPVDSVVIAAGARPLLYGAYRTLVDPGDTAIYPVPTLEQQPLRVPLRRARGPDDRLGRVQLLPDPRPAPPAPLDGAPPDPQLAAEPHRHRHLEGGPHGDHGDGRRGEPAPRGDRRRGRSSSSTTRCTGRSRSASATHHTPVALVPESAPYMILLDAISKAFCATGHARRAGASCRPRSAGACPTSSATSARGRRRPSRSASRPSSTQPAAIPRVPRVGARQAGPAPRGALPRSHGHEEGRLPGGRDRAAGGASTSRRGSTSSAAP